MKSSTQIQTECKLLKFYYCRYEYYYDDGIEGTADGMMEDEEFDSDDALFFDNNDLANRIWEDDA